MHKASGPGRRRRLHGGLEEIGSIFSRLLTSRVVESSPAGASNDLTATEVVLKMAMS